VHVDVPDAVRELALHPFRELPPQPEFERIEGDGFLLVISPFPTAQAVEPIGLSPDAVAESVEITRGIARERGKKTLVWFVGPDERDLAGPLEAAGLVHEDTPGFEAVERAMALLRPPNDRDAPAEVTVKETSTYEQYAAAAGVMMAAFDVPEEMRTDMIDGMPQRWRSYSHPSSPGRQFVASIDGRIVGAAFAVLGEAGVNLFGGGVLEEARGRGVYSALIVARWEAAAARGTPALTVQAGRMSGPVLHGLGFQDIGEVHLYVDKVPA